MKMKSKEPKYIMGGDRIYSWRCECGYKNRNNESDQQRLCASCGKDQDAVVETEAVHIGSLTEEQSTIEEGE
jgi:Zn finger protein HypA/HybF involved in hydrogenase expression